MKLRNAYSGICGSDLHVFSSPEASGLDFSRPHPVTGSTPPQILGHEFAGTAVADGDGDGGLRRRRPGRRVARVLLRPLRRLPERLPVTWVIVASSAG